MSFHRSRERKGWPSSIDYRDETTSQLYDLSRDEGEKNSLIQSMPEKAQEMKAQWDKWNVNNKDRYFPTLGEDNWWKRNSKK